MVSEWVPWLITPPFPRAELTVPFAAFLTHMAPMLLTGARLTAGLWGKAIAPIAYIYTTIPKVTVIIKWTKRCCNQNVKQMCSEIKMTFFRYSDIIPKTSVHMSKKTATYLWLLKETERTPAPSMNNHIPHHSKPKPPPKAKKQSPSLL